MIKGFAPYRNVHNAATKPVALWGAVLFAKRLRSVSKGLLLEQSERPWKSSGLFRQ